jgi:hypothetical protein
VVEAGHRESFAGTEGEKEEIEVDASSEPSRRCSFLSLLQLVSLAGGSRSRIPPRMSPHVAGLSANFQKAAGPKPPVSLTSALSIGEIRSALAASAAANRDWYDRERPIGK